VRHTIKICQLTPEERSSWSDSCISQESICSRLALRQKKLGMPSNVVDAGGTFTARNEVSNAVA